MHRMTTTTRAGMARMVKMYDGRVARRVGMCAVEGGWAGEDAGGHKGTRGRGSKIGLPISNDDSDNDIRLDIDCPPTDTSNDTKTRPIWAPMALPLPLPSESNIGPYHLPPVPNTPFICVSPIFDIGDHEYQAHFPSRQWPRWWASRLCMLRIRGFTHPSPNIFKTTPL